MNLRVVYLAAAGAALALVTALPSGAAPAHPTRSKAGWKSPEEAWEKTCARCHITGVGPELRGRALPPEYINAVVRNGMRAMPAFPHSMLDDATLNGVARIVSKSKLAKPATSR